MDTLRELDVRFKRARTTKTKEKLVIEANKERYVAMVLLWLFCSELHADVNTWHKEAILDSDFNIQSRPDYGWYSVFSILDAAETMEARICI